MSAPTQNQEPKEEPKQTLYTLEVDDDNWDRVLTYVVSNKSKGITQLVADLSTKYKISASVKKTLKSAIDAAK